MLLNDSVTDYYSSRFTHSNLIREEKKKLQNRLKKISITSVAMILLSCSMAPLLLANDQQLKIVIVKSDTLDEYNEAFSGFVAALDDAAIRFQTKVLTLKTDGQQDIDSLITIGSEKPDAIVTIGTMATQHVREKITKLPVFFTMAFNPEKNGIACSDSHSTSNLFGVRLDVPIATQLKLIKQVFSNLKAIGILYHPQQDSQVFRQCREEAHKLNIKIVPGEIQTEEHIPTALKEIRARSNVLLLISNQYVLNYSSLKYILMYGLSNNFPVIGLSEFHVKAGALLAVRADYRDAGRQIGQLIIDVFSNQLIDRQFIYSPQKTKLFINKRTADMMGIAIPVMFLSQAEQVYE